MRISRAWAGLSWRIVIFSISPAMLRSSNQLHQRLRADQWSI
jgi:hypothetical protein